jgi:hypothetical protein
MGRSRSSLIEVLTRQLVVGLRKTTTTSARIVGVPAEIPNEHLQNVFILNNTHNKMYINCT